MTDEELRAALNQIISDAEQLPGVMGPTDDHLALVPVRMLRAARDRMA